MNRARRLSLPALLLVLAVLAWLAFRSAVGGGPGDPERIPRASAGSRPEVERPSALLATDAATAADAAAASARKTLPAVRGRVVGAPRNAPVAGCEARLWTPAGIVAAATTGADGRFALALPERSEPEKSDEVWEAWVQVVAPEGWTIREEPAELTEANAGLELLFHAVREEPRAPLRLTVVDGDGGPVPLYAVSFLASDGATELVTSDAMGLLDTELAYATGDVFYTEVDHGGVSSGLHQHVFAHSAEAGGERVPLPVHLGPTYLIDVELPADEWPGRFYARVVPEAYAYTGRNIRGHTAPLREGEPRWARFRPFPFERFITGARTGPYRIEIHDRRKRWFGFAPVLGVVGPHPGVVRVELAPLSTLSGRVLDRRGEPVVDAKVRLDAALRGPGAWYLREQSARANGVFRFEGIHPGAYLLRARTPTTGVAEAAVTFDGGRDVVRDLVLTPVPTGPVRGRIRSRTGTYTGRAWLTLTPREDALSGYGMQRRVTLVDDGSGRVEGEFDFGELPIGEYELSIDADERLYEPESIVLTPPAEDLVFTCLDDLALADLAFDARDARTGAAPAELFVRYRLGAEVFAEELDGEHALGRALRADLPLEWWLLADGYRPARGDWSAFHPSTEARWQGAKVARVTLEPGWGRVVSVVDATGAPLAGAVVELDGERAAETGADGRVVVGAEESPTTFTATHGALVERTATESRWEIRLALGSP